MQSVHAPAPDPDQVPLPHNEHDVAPTNEKRPGEQVVGQLIEGVLVATAFAVPATQGRHSCDPELR